MNVSEWKENLNSLDECLSYWINQNARSNKRDSIANAGFFYVRYVIDSNCDVYAILDNHNCNTINKIELASCHKMKRCFLINQSRMCVWTCLISVNQWKCWNTACRRFVRRGLNILGTRNRWIVPGPDNGALASRWLLRDWIEEL